MIGNCNSYWKSKVPRGTLMNRRFTSNFAWILGTCGVLWLAGAGTASAFVAPELDPGSAASGIALALGAALLLAERYRRR
jgi:drug/metabolite transporter (DMT)-like permease